MVARTRGLVYVGGVRRLSASIVFASCFGAVGCNLILGGYKVGASSGGSSSTSGTASGSPTTGSTSTAESGSTSTGSSMGLAVSPGQTTLLVGTTLTFTATLNGTPFSNVTWSVDEATGGTISAGGRYAAPMSGGSFHVRATSKADASFAEATVLVSATAKPIAIGPAGGLTGASGFATQSHVAYSPAAGEWWLFYDDTSAPNLDTMHSTDFKTWQAGEHAVLSQGHSGDGRDLALASGTFGGHDVVHVTEGTSMLGRYHLRAVMTPGHVTFDAPVIVNTGGSDAPDGSNTIILADGTVIDSTGWQSTPQTPPLSPCGNGDVDVFIADAKEDGVTSFGGVAFGEQVIWCVDNTVNARRLIDTGAAMVAVYEDGVSNPDPTNILTSTRKNDGTWLPFEPPAGPDVIPPKAFATDQTFGLDDWNAVLAGGSIHAVRRLGQFYEHQTFDQTGQAWAAASAIPPQASVGDSGLFLVPYGDGLLLAAIGGATGNPILFTYFDGMTWSNWSTLVEAHDTRTFLGGYAPGGGVKPALLWTEDGSLTAALVP